MKSISLRGIDDEIAQRLREEAQRQGTSVNALILQFVRKGVGFQTTAPRRPVYHDLDALADTWSAEEASAFLDSLSDFEQVDRGLWG
jgi:plasmid stability protein